MNSTTYTYINPPPEYSTRACGSTNASQSDAWVGSKPIDWHLYNAKIMFTSCPKKKINFWPKAFVPSITLNAANNLKKLLNIYLNNLFKFSLLLIKSILKIWFYDSYFVEIIKMIMSSFWFKQNFMFLIFLYLKC